MQSEIKHPQGLVTDLAPCCRWRSYFTSGSSALYLLSYSLFYFWTRLDITRTVPMVMYFCYMTMVSVSFFCLTGTIGFYGEGPCAKSACSELAAQSASSVHAGVTCSVHAIAACCQVRGTA